VYVLKVKSTSESEIKFGVYEELEVDSKYETMYPYYVRKISAGRRFRKVIEVKNM
jgi:hypothetical protein